MSVSLVLILVPDFLGEVSGEGGVDFCREAWHVSEIFRGLEVLTALSRFKIINNIFSRQSIIRFNLIAEVNNLKNVYKHANTCKDEKTNVTH